MQKSIELLNKGFRSSTGTTPEFLIFFNTFKKELTIKLKVLFCDKIEIRKGHFYVSGFFTSSTGNIYYFSLPDVRSFVSGGNHYGSLLVRTAKSYTDYSGGINNYVVLNDNFSECLERLIK